jgi:GAF domain-containing protein
MSERDFPDSTPNDADPLAAVVEAESSAAPGVVTAATHADLSAIVLASQPLRAVLRRIAELAVKTIPGADDASVTLVERGRPKTVAFCGQLAFALDERQYGAGFGPCLDAAVSAETIVVDTHDENGRYPEFARLARRQGIRHVLSVGMPNLQQISGGLNIYGSESASAFDPHACEAAVTFAGYAAVTLFNAALYAVALEEVAQMHQAMATRSSIEQAKGIIMGQQHCGADEAFRILAGAASRSHRKVRDVAQTVIDSATDH